ncbi:FMN reductase [Streptomyces sp. NBC_00178]|uniref:FMN reductase n=1 Tax=Streptomyces sp. NBC_00178 TaxID=2975672 RepID=UPI002E2D5525|nr:FMN reductase [Streptomyces sp. NBC_00178]
MKRTLVIVSAGLRLPSSTRMLADRIADAARTELGLLGDQVELEFVEVRSHAHDLVNHLLTGQPSTELASVFDTIARADGLITVTPTFTASYNGLFKMFFDSIDDQVLVDKPVLIAATGGTGRHSLVLDHALRPMFTYLHAVVMPTGVFAAPEDWGSGDDSQASLTDRVARAGRELAREVHRREAPVIVDPYADPTPFSEMLLGE